MKRLLLFFFLGVGGLHLGFTQALELQFQLLDQSSAAPIADAHVFISDASIGTTSDSDGRCQLQVSAQETQVLIITHVSYETLIISPEDYRQLLDGVPVEMQNNGIDLSEIQLTAKRSGQWKKNFKKFSKALFGEGKAAAACEILNPEVLRFEEKEGSFRATAIDLLEIQNDYLGYRVQFWLSELAIAADGSTYYQGYGQFIDQSEKEPERFNRRREQAYGNSLSHFLRSLQQSKEKDELQDYGYQVAIEKYVQDKFEMLFEPQPQELVQFDSTTGNYVLIFPEFLTVRHTEVKVANGREQQVSISGAEQQRFGSARTQSVGSGTQSAISRLYKIAPLLRFDQRGNIINKAVVKEYGYWANQRLATTLPVDYKGFADWKANVPSVSSFDTLGTFQYLVGRDVQKRKEALARLRTHWSSQYVASLLDVLRLSTDEELVRNIRSLLQERVPEMETDYYSALQWLWRKPPNYGSYYKDFKAYLYRTIDAKFAPYFEQSGQQINIRLDEVVWGGVRQDGIPPLRSPKMLTADQADYLAGTDIVFGLVIDGEARAYPKRILAWHEFFTDDIAGRSIAGVYCTLCGTVIIYDATVDGLTHELGTSGFLYRSNKLMYDRATQSLWSTIFGRPVVGPLVGQNIELTTLPVETTSWEEWRSRHSNTDVLSLDTGYERNYEEGEAYRDYFADDELMFPVPRQDERLANKARVFIPRPENYDADPLAVSVDYLRRKRLHRDQIGEQSILIITESTGASRVYAINDQQFRSYRQGQLLDKNGQEWMIDEVAIIGPNGERLLQLPAHEAFWFAWVNVFPETRLVD
ncbi:MAG: DUF3179 domain-containing (seleno)protein [Bacteroidota bacterium]